MKLTDNTLKDIYTNAIPTTHDIEVITGIGFTTESVIASTLDYIIKSVNLNKYEILERLLTMTCEPPTVEKDDYFTMKEILNKAAEKYNKRNDIIE